MEPCVVLYQDQEEHRPSQIVLLLIALRELERRLQIPVKARAHRQVHLAASYFLSPLVQLLFWHLDAPEKCKALIELPFWSLEPMLLIVVIDSLPQPVFSPFLRPPSKREELIEGSGIGPQ